MLEELSQKLETVLKKLRGQGRITESNIGESLRAIRRVLLEADVNFRVAADASSTVYLLGRARSREERDKALKLARATEGAKKVVDFVDVRP